MITLTISQPLHKANNHYKNALLDVFLHYLETIENLTNLITLMFNSEVDFRPVATFITKTEDSITLYEPTYKVINELQRVMYMSKGDGLDHIAHYKSLNLAHDEAEGFGGSDYYFFISLPKAI